MPFIGSKVFLPSVSWRDLHPLSISPSTGETLGVTYSIYYNSTLCLLKLMPIFYYVQSLAIFM